MRQFNDIYDINAEYLLTINIINRFFYPELLEFS